MLKNRFDKLFVVFLLSLFFTFFSFRPLNSSWYRIITADGLGYYSYLPAKFIYSDKDLEFKWFNDVYNKYYSYNSFAVPDENFMAPYKDRRINKYYPGLSFLWLPAFIPTHYLCKLFHLNANGFSLPYQLAIGITSLLYVCLGLWYLRKLLMKLFENELMAFLLPIAVFYGTNLFTYTIYVGTFSHAYSFVFITIAYYYAYCFFNYDEQKFKNALIFILCFLLVIFIRPFNILFIIGIPFLMKDFTWKDLKKIEIKFTKLTIGILLIIALLIVYQLTLLFHQTHSLFPNTYSNEKFHFERPSHFGDVLWSFHAGWFVYVPIAFIACFSLFFLKRKKKILFLFLLLTIVVYIYSNWWYYSIVTRAIVDYTAIVALLLGVILYFIQNHSKTFRAVISIIFLSVVYFQLKAYQLRNNILDNNYTYSEYFWRNFFTIHRVNIFPVHPKTVLQQQSHLEDFEDKSIPFITNENKFDGEYSQKLFSGNHFSISYNTKLPDFYSESGIRKIKVSFWAYITGDAKELQLLGKTVSNKDSLKQDVVFYLDESNAVRNKWGYHEFGWDVLPEVNSSDTLKVFFWNVKGYDKIYIDKVKTEIFLTDNSMEMIP